MAKVWLDAGHGGTDPGALGNGLREKDITLPVTLETGEILERHGVNVGYSRTTDKTVSLKERTDMANKFNADRFISIHCNAFKDSEAQGVETFSHIGSTRGKNLAVNIHNEVIKERLYTKNRGTKTANFHVLRETKMAAALIELAFITNKEDSNLLIIKQKQFANSIAKGILKDLGIKYIENIKPTLNTGVPIVSKATATIEQMKIWAKNKGANQKFIDLAPLFYDLSVKSGVNPVVTYAQSAKETGYFKFGGVLDITFNNPCGMKVSAGGRDKDPNAHQRFKNWEEGIQAQVDHLALYAGAPGYPKTDTPDPRHFNFIKGTAPTVEELGGKWAPSQSYGTDIVKMMKELESIKVSEAEEKELDKIKISLHGKELEIEGIKMDNTNYIPVRFLGALGYDVGWQNGVVTIEYKGVK